MINIDVLLKAAEYIEKCDAQTINTQNNSLSEMSSLSIKSANNLSAIKLCQERYLNKSDKSIHNTLEKNRRAHLKECFENLQNELPQYRDKKATNLSILNYTLKYVEQSQKKYHENEMEKERLFRKQIFLKQRLKKLLFELERENIDYKSILKDTALIDINLESMNLESLMKMNESGRSEMDESEKSSFLKSNKFNGTSQRKRSSYSLTVTNSSTDSDLKEEYMDDLECKKQKLTKSSQNGCVNSRHRNYSIDESMISKQKQQNMLDELDSNYEFSNDFEEDDDCSTDTDDYNSLNENESSSSEFRNNSLNDPILVNHDVNYNTTCKNSINGGSGVTIAKSEFELLLNYGNELRDIYKKCEKLSDNARDEIKEPLFLLDEKQLAASSQLIVNNKNKIILDEYRMYNTAFKVKKDKFLKEAAQSTGQTLVYPLLKDASTINDSSNLIILNSNQNKIATNEN